MTVSSNPSFDIVVFGATSFVGEILCQYLVTNYSETSSLKWAMAARSQAKLDSLKQRLGEHSKSIPVFIADANDVQALTHFVQQTEVVVSTVGPYALYGSKMVKVCAENGTGYCDLTGEPQWIHRMIERYEASAKASGAHIVHCCGFDSIPSDLGVYHLQKEARAEFGTICPSIKMSVKGASGGASGGTIASGLNAAKEASEDPDVRRILANPYALCARDSSRNPKQKDIFRARRDSDFDGWLAPFIMASINTRVVLRSNQLTDYAYGDDFYYEETMMTGPGLKGAAIAHGIAAALASFVFAGAVKPIRNLLRQYVLPKPGEGPSPRAQLEGYFDIRFVGKTRDGKMIKTKVTGDRDPGYGSTAKMLAEAAICMAKNRQDTDIEPGFLTPSVMMGDALLDRLQAHAGLSFEKLSE